MLKIENLQKRYGKKQVLCGVDLQIDRGEILSVVGSNGSGKSTLLKIIARLARADGGKIVFEKGVFCKCIIETPSFFPSMTGEENVKALIGDDFRRDSALQMFDLFEMRDAFDLKVRKYSLGMKQKLAISCLFLSKADLLLLDEPTNALDETSVKTFRCLMTEYVKRGKSVLLSSHDFSYVNAVSHKIYRFDGGKLIRES